MNSGSPIADRDLRNTFGKAIDGGEPRRNLHALRGDVFPRRANFYCEASDQRDFSSDLKLLVAVGECLLCLPALCDIDDDAKHPLWWPSPSYGMKQRASIHRTSPPGRRMRVSTLYSALRRSKGWPRFLL